jgi:hypothetical protein
MAIITLSIHDTRRNNRLCEVSLLVKWSKILHITVSIPFSHKVASWSFLASQSRIHYSQKVIHKLSKILLRNRSDTHISPFFVFFLYIGMEGNANFMFLIDLDFIAVAFVVLCSILSAIQFLLELCWNLSGYSSIM